MGAGERAKGANSVSKGLDKIKTSEVWETSEVWRSWLSPRRKGARGGEARRDDAAGLRECQSRGQRCDRRRGLQVKRRNPSTARKSSSVVTMASAPQRSIVVRCRASRGRKARLSI